MRTVSYIFYSNLKSTLLVVFILLSHLTIGQISYGGKPLPLHAGIGARTIAPMVDMFVDMPSFDQQAALRNSTKDQSMLKSLEFAHKFDAFLRPDNSGIQFTSGNMKVWRVGIRSKGAYSLNILFTKFNLPPGAQLFVYNANQSEILGSFTENNNSNLHMLPTQPIGGDELIVEYLEPLNPLFEGEIEVGEVNHDYVGIFRATEPRDPAQDCHPNLVCYPEDIQPGSGVVGLIINGTTYCTGSLINNSAEDGTPYLITATHCLNRNYNASFLGNRKYDIVAGSIVAFFNYQSPLCDMNIRGPLQMTMASADSVLISEKHDISLLKLKETPPAEYQPYYLGWNAEASPTAPFHGIHHPNGGIKKVAIDNDKISLGSFDLPNYYDEAPNSFWEINAWDTGNTEVGSSGSPLVDKDKRIVGTLTGGVSMCSSPRGPDYYGSLTQLWDAVGSINNPNPISFYLNPTGASTRQMNGLNPYQQQPYTRSSNFKPADKATKQLYQQSPFFATHSPLGYNEFAEQFHADTDIKLQGVFLSSPATQNIADMNIRIRVYVGEEKPDRLVYEQPFNYNFRYFGNNSFHDSNRSMDYQTENYIRFDQPVNISGTFYISYHEANGVPSGYTTFNAESRKIGSGIVSTAWLKNSSGWVRSSENIENPLNTSLLIVPYVMGKNNTTVEPEKEQTELTVYHSNEMKRIFFESNIELLEWEIFNALGIKIHQESTDISMNRGSYPSAHLPKGVYVVRVKTLDGKVATKKVLVR